MDVVEPPPRLDETAPIFVKYTEHKCTDHSPGPARHPYCELNVLLRGEVMAMVESEESPRLVNDILLLGPGVPHWGRVTKFPHRTITVYFLPSALLEFGNPHVSVSILRRFTSPRTLEQRLIRLPLALHRILVRGLQEMLAEFRSRGFGWELRTAAILFAEIVRFMRWEETHRPARVEEAEDLEWRPVVQALRHLRENYAEQVYAADVARSAGVSETRLKLVFRRTVGMPWVKYLQIYRIHRAALLLCEGGVNITEIALAVGFESPSHFNATFRAVMGEAPSEYLLRRHGRQPASMRRIRAARPNGLAESAATNQPS